MHIETIRLWIRAKQYLVYDHAVVEGFKDGLSVADMLYAVLNGEIIEGNRSGLGAFARPRMEFGG